MAERRQDGITQTRTRIYKQGFHKAVYRIYEETHGDNEKEVLYNILKRIVGDDRLVDYFIGTNPDQNEEKFHACPRNYCSDGAGGCVECPEYW